MATLSFASDPGDGVSLEMVDLLAGDVAGNWRASLCSAGSSPGEHHCFPESGDATDLVITEVMANPLAESTGEYVEIYNPTTSDTVLYPQNPGNGLSVERLDWTTARDSSTNWLASTCPSGASPGAENCIRSTSGASATSSYDILITEVMANADTESTGEFVELYNAGTTDIDLLGWVLYDGDAVDTIEGLTHPTDTVLAAGEYALILDADYASDCSTIPAGALLLSTDDSTLCSGLATDDTITLFEDNTVSLVDSFSFPWNPGNAISIERVDLAVGDVVTNWAASVCSGGSSPGQGSGP